MLMSQNTNKPNASANVWYLILAVVACSMAIFALVQNIQLGNNLYHLSLSVGKHQQEQETIAALLAGNNSLTEKVYLQEQQVAKLQKTLLQHEDKLAKANKANFDPAYLQLRYINSALEIAEWALIQQHSPTQAAQIIQALQHRASGLPEQYQHIQKALSQDLVYLQGLELPKQTMILKSIQTVITKLPDITKQQVKLPEAKPLESDSKLLDRALQLISHKRQQNVPPLLEAGEHYLLMQQVKLLLNQLSLAVVMYDDDLYQQLVKHLQKVMQQQLNFAISQVPEVFAELEQLQKHQLVYPSWKLASTLPVLQAMLANQPSKIL